MITEDARVYVQARIEAFEPEEYVVSLYQTYITIVEADPGDLV